MHPTEHPVPKIHDSLLLHDLARLEYGRLLWKNPVARRRLLKHWSDTRHPYCGRFKTHRKEVERILKAPVEQDDELDRQLQTEGLSLRALVREIPPVFGSFYGTKNQQDQPRSKAP